MGVPGLWNELHAAAEQHSLTRYTVEKGFEENLSGLRALTVGIDVSLWFFHATKGKGLGGQNPELRLLFHRCCRLLALPLLVLFVFDGPSRPGVKRDKRVVSKEHWLVNGMKALIDAFGFAWCQAPAEAEAELAYLNRLGAINFVLTDDVDVFLFGANTVIRNPHARLAGSSSTRSAADKDNARVLLYQRSNIVAHCRLDTAGMILIALLAGGDYSHGVHGVGIKTAVALARNGYGRRLSHFFAEPHSGEEVEDFFRLFRLELANAIDGTSSLPPGVHKPQWNMAAAIATTFDPKEAPLYTRPITSATVGGFHNHINRNRSYSLAKVAAACEQYFEWGTMEGILKKAETMLWRGAVLRVLREEALRRDRVIAGATVAVGEFPLLDDLSISQLALLICKTRTNTSTDHLLEYRLEFNPAQFKAQLVFGISGTRVEDDTGSSAAATGKGKKAAKPRVNQERVRIWLPAVIVDTACPQLVQSFRQAEAEKAEKKGKGRARANVIVISSDESGDEEVDQSHLGFFEISSDEEVVGTSKGKGHEVIDISDEEL